MYSRRSYEEDDRREDYDDRYEGRRYDDRGRDERDMQASRGGPPRRQQQLPMATPADDAVTSKGRTQDALRSIMANAKQDVWKTVVVKATNRDILPPKGKHLRSIMDGLDSGSEGNVETLNREIPAGAILYHLQKRTHEPSWLVVSKALTVLHFTMRQTQNRAYLDAVTTKWRPMFLMDRFTDEAPGGFAYAKFIKTYGAYLATWSKCRVVIKYPPDKEQTTTRSHPAHPDDQEARYPRRFVDMKETQLLHEIPLLLDVLNAIVDIDLSGPVASSPVLKATWAVLVKDIGHFWNSLTEAMTTLADAVALPGGLTSGQGRAAIQLFREYASLLDVAPNFFDSLARAKPEWTPIRVTPLSPGMIHLVEDSIRGVGGPRRPHDDLVAPVVDSLSSDWGGNEERESRARGAGYGAWREAESDRDYEGRNSERERRTSSPSRRRRPPSPKLDDDPFLIGIDNNDSSDPFQTTPKENQLVVPRHADAKNQSIIPVVSRSGRHFDRFSASERPGDPEEDLDPFGGESGQFNARETNNDNDNYLNPRDTSWQPPHQQNQALMMQQQQQQMMALRQQQMQQQASQLQMQQQMLMNQMSNMSIQPNQGGYTGQRGQQLHGSRSIGQNHQQGYHQAWNQGWNQGWNQP